MFCIGQVKYDSFFIYLFMTKSILFSTPTVEGLSNASDMDIYYCKAFTHWSFMWYRPTATQCEKYINKEQEGER